VGRGTAMSVSESTVDDPSDQAPQGADTRQETR